MRKSSRLWWLHGAILLSAVIGCKNCGGGSCGGSGASSAPPYGSPVSGAPVVSGGATMYSQSSTPGYSGATGMSSGSAFPSSASAGYGMPNTASSMSPGLGGIR